MANRRASAPHADPAMALLRAVWALDHALVRKSKRMQRAIGVTGTQRFVLRLAIERPGITAGELAGLLHLHASTLTGVLDRLTSRGLLERLADPADGRKARFRVSDRGRRIGAPRDGTVEACVLEALDRSEAGDVDATLRVLAALTEVLGREDS